MPRSTVRRRGGNTNGRLVMCIIGRNTENKSELNSIKEIVDDCHENISYTYADLDTSQVLLSTAKILIQNCNNK